MPHVIVKMWPGKSERPKQRLADAIARDLIEILNCGDESVSIGIEEVAAADWAEKVFKPDIDQKSDALYKEPGYSM